MAKIVQLILFLILSFFLNFKFNFFLLKSSTKKYPIVGAMVLASAIIVQCAFGMIGVNLSNPSIIPIYGRDARALPLKDKMFAKRFMENIGINVPPMNIRTFSVF